MTQELYSLELSSRTMDFKEGLAASGAPHAGLQRPMTGGNSMSFDTTGHEVDGQGDDHAQPS
jgi:hypothetical protein